MKKLNLYLLLLATGMMAMTFSSCNDDDPEPVIENVTIRLSETKLSFSHNGDIKDVAVTITPANVTWKAQSNQEWAKVDAKPDNSGFTVTVGKWEEETTQARFATVTVSADNAESQTVTVEQTPENFVAELDANPKILNFKAEGDTKKITVESNILWEAKSDDKWIDIKNMDDGFNVVVGVNDSDKPLTGEIIVSGTGVESVKIAVTQDAADTPPVEYYIEVDTDPADIIYFMNDGGIKTINIDTNAGYTVTDPGLEWIEVKADYNANTITLDALSNDKFMDQEAEFSIIPAEDTELETITYKIILLERIDFETFLGTYEVTSDRQWAFDFNDDPYTYSDTWQSTITYDTYEGVDYYISDNFGNRAPVYAFALDYVDGTMIIDYGSAMVGNTANMGVPSFCVVFEETWGRFGLGNPGNGMETGVWDPIEKTMTFSAQYYDEEQGAADISMGILAWSRYTGAYAGAFTDLHANMVFRKIGSSVDSQKMGVPGYTRDYIANITSPLAVARLAEKIIR